jgi:hypothetical protein
MPPISLFTSLYCEKNNSRSTELLHCLKQNLSYPSIRSVKIYLEKTESPCESDKLLTRRIEYRPRYSDFIEWANLTANGETITIIANSDIYFDSSLDALAEKLRPHQCAALSRWDEQPDGTSKLFDRADSQDVWIFKGPIRSLDAAYLIGVPRCDNRFLYELRKAGYDVINPSFSVRAIHRHAGMRSEYPATIAGQYVPPPYAYLWPHNLLSLSSTLAYRYQNPSSALGWRFDWRKIYRSLPFRAVNKLKSLFKRIHQS